MPFSFSLPKTATAPFCPSEVQGSVAVPEKGALWRRILTFVGPGLLVSVGYMDPGNWATDIEAGSKHGYAMLWVIVASSLAAIVLQVLSLRLGIVTRKDLARTCRDQYHPRVNALLWIMAEVAIVACDVAEVLGSALALHLLFGISLAMGVAITAFDTLIVLGLKGHGFRQVEAIVLGLITTIGLCFTAQLVLVGPSWHEVMQGLHPDLHIGEHPEMLYLAIGILGATIMPHNLYMHSSIVQTRHIADNDERRREALRFSTFDTVFSLVLALLVNAAILVLAGAAFHATGYTEVTDIGDAYHLLDPILGGKLAALLFGAALLASGQSSTFTGTIAGQIVMEGFLNLKIPCWKRRQITRGLALLPALLGVLWLGDAGVGKILVASQVVLSFQLPFAIWPLVRFTSDRNLMGVFASGTTLKVTAWILFAVITVANLWLIASAFS